MIGSIPESYHGWLADDYAPPSLDDLRFCRRIALMRMADAEDGDPYVDAARTQDELDDFDDAIAETISTELDNWSARL